MSVSKDMADPDLQIRGGGRSQNKIFWPFRPQSGLKIWAGGQVPQAPPLDPSLAHFVQ